MAEIIAIVNRLEERADEHQVESEIPPCSKTQTKSHITTYTNLVAQIGAHTNLSRRCEWFVLSEVVFQSHKDRHQKPIATATLYAKTHT